jgi:hypothetical protein
LVEVNIQTLQLDITEMHLGLVRIFIKLENYLQGKLYDIAGLILKMLLRFETIP